jgi:predicted O-linked N-acetylglucosamine transferase (SPINDLY family)
VINAGPYEDDFTYRWKRNADHYYQLPTSAAKIAEAVRGLDLDALIFTDVGTDALSVQLSLLRLARRQFAAWGIPTTSGSPTIDYYLTSGEMQPADGQGQYTEQLACLSGSGLSLPRARPQPSNKTQAELGVPVSGFYLIAQNPMKLLPGRDHIFREITERTAKPIVLCESVNPEVGDMVLQRMRRAGVNVVGMPKLSVEDFLRVIQLADCVLDSFDYGGGITTIDTLSLRKPLVTMRGDFMRSRLATPFIKQAGLEGFITDSVQGYIDLACDPGPFIAATEASDPDAIFGDDRPAKEIDDFLLGLT